MPPSDEDDHVAMTGPSYRMTGPAYRGTGNRGTGTRTAQAPGTGSPAPGSAPRRNKFISGILDQGKLPQAQRFADRCVMELRPLFRSRYRKYGGPALFAPGDAVPVQILSSSDFDLQILSHQTALLKEERALLEKYAPKRVADYLGGRGRGGSVGSSASTASGKPLSEQDKEVLVPTGGRLEPTSRAGGFFSAENRRIYIRIDQVDVAAVAHELTHAYTSALWNELQVALALQRQTVKTARGSLPIGTVFTYIDEGLASLLAQTVLDDWYATPRKSDDLPRPPTAPRGLVGYLPDIIAFAEDFAGVIDGTLGTPKANTFAAFFGGQITFSVDEDDPLSSYVKFGRDRRRPLRELL
jgi:hypothetical protein